jgi:signal transduction histidine kinase
MRSNLQQRKQEEACKPNRAEKEDSQASVSINDTGSGIQPEIMPKLFLREKCLVNSC